LSGCQAFRDQRDQVVQVTADDLEEINRLRTVASVVSNAIHDLNNSLQVMSGAAEVLGTKSALGEAEQRWVRTIGARAGTAAVLLERVASYTRRGAAGPAVVDLVDLAETAVALRHFTQRRGAVSAVVERGGSPPYRASADGRLVLQVFLNLLLNAEAALAGRDNAAIRMRVERAGETCRVSVTDNGPGINKTDWASLVAPAPLPAGEPGLAGYGLWVCARLAGRCGGRLEIGDAPPTGAAITLYLPSA
jgi:signal transduction histidine kinase